MPVSVTRLTERNLEAVFGRTPYLLIRVDRIPMAQMQPGLTDYLERRFPGLFAFATVSRSDFSPQRLGDLFQSAVGRLRSGVLDGYYLFEAGLVVGHHSGQTRPSSISYGHEAEEEAQRRRILSATPPSLAPRGADLEAVRQLVAYFEPIIERKQRASGFADDGTSAGSTHSAPPPPPRAAPPPPAARAADDPDDPYVVLGIERGASQEEIKAAFRTQIKLNHPDKVAHLSPALQQFAASQTLRVKWAYDTLTRRG